MQRPMGITILAVLAAIGGAFAILAGLALMALSGATADLAIPGLSGLAAIIGLVTVALGVAELGLAYGFWGLKPWAWMLGIVLEVIAIVLDVVQFRSATASSTIVGVVIAGIIIYYLWQPHVRRAFGQTV